MSRNKKRKISDIEYRFTNQISSGIRSSVSTTMDIKYVGTNTWFYEGSYGSYHIITLSPSEQFSSNEPTFSCNCSEILELPSTKCKHIISIMVKMFKNQLNAATVVEEERYTSQDISSIINKLDEINL
jgi:hypothetical protein